MALYFSDDDPDVLDKLELYDVMRKITWANKNDTSRMWADFPDDIKEKMENNNIALHGHTMSLSLETFNKYPKLREFFKVT